jgi:hypothetical protein
VRRFEIRIDEVDAWLADNMYRYGRAVLRVSLAVVFIWFGALKPLGVSPAEELVRRTVYWMDPGLFVPLLGYWEMALASGCSSVPSSELHSCCWPCRCLAHSCPS